MPDRAQLAPLTFLGHFFNVNRGTLWFVVLCGALFGLSCSVLPCGALSCALPGLDGAMWGFAVLSFTPMRFVVLCDAFSFVVLCGALWCSVAPTNARHCGLA